MNIIILEYNRRFNSCSISIDGKIKKGTTSLLDEVIEGNDVYSMASFYAEDNSIRIPIQKLREKANSFSKVVCLPFKTFEAEVMKPPWFLNDAVNISNQITALGLTGKDFTAGNDEQLAEVRGDFTIIKMNKLPEYIYWDEEEYILYTSNNLTKKIIVNYKDIYLPNTFESKFSSVEDCIQYLNLKKL